jgi:thioester reductase-like protein
MKILLTGATGYIAKRLLLYAEMKLPVEAWLESKIETIY